MTAAQELERLVVRIVGDGSHYKRTLDAVVSQSKKAVADMNKSIGRPIRIGGTRAPGASRVSAKGAGGAASMGLKDHAKAVEEVSKALPKATTAQNAFNKSVAGAKAPLNQARDSAGRFVAGLKKIKTEQDASGISTKRHGSILGTFGSVLGGIKQKVMGVAEGLKSTGQAMGLVGTLMAVSTTLPILGAAAAVVKLGADAETTKNQFQVMLGADVGNKMLGDIKKMGAETPFEFPELAASAKSLVGFGIANEEVLPDLKMLGDVSAGTGKDIKELSIIFGQIQGMGRLQGQDFLQLVNAGFPVAEIAKTIGTDMKGLKGYMEDGLVTFDHVKETFRRLTSDGGQFNNMMVVLSQTFAGKMSTLMDNIKMVGAAMGGYLLPTLKGIIDKLIAAAAWFGGLSESVHKTVMFVVALVGGFAPLVMIIGSVVTVLGFMGTTILGVIAATASAVMWFVAAGVAIYGIIKGVQLLVDHIYGEGSFVAAIQEAALAVWNFVEKTAGFIANIGTNWSLLTDWLGKNWKNILKDVGMMWLTALKNMVKNVVVIIDTMMRLWLLWQGYMGHLFKQLFTAEFIDWLLTGVIDAIGILVRFAEAAWNTIKNIFTGGGTGELSALASELGARMAQDFNDGMNGDLLGGAARIVKEQTAKLVPNLDGFESSLTELPTFATDLTTTVDKVGDGAKKDAGPIKPMSVEKKKEKEKKQEDNTVKTGEFKTMNLRQFKITPVGTRNGPKKQEVTDKGVQDKLDGVIGAINNKDNVALMGR